MSVNANTSERCADCGSQPAVVVKQGVQFGGRWIVWVLCVPCRLLEAARGGESTQTRTEHTLDGLSIAAGMENQ